MTIDPVTGYNVPDAKQTASRSDTVSQGDFLKMLTTQLKSQDPLNPLEGSEFASQLATFSQLQELTTMNKTLSASLDANLMLAQSINNNMATTLVGQTVRAEVNQVQVGGSGDVTMNYHLPESATNISIDVVDADGITVRTIDVPSQVSGDHSAVWDGKTNDGVRVPSGTYTFNVHATNADGGTVTVENYIQGRVTAVNYADGQVMLSVNGIDIYLGQVVSVIGDDVSAKKG
jgi:flagellar basal-body rod modification protein FlgD